MEGMEKQLTAVEWLNSEVERLTTKAGIHLSWEMMDSIIRQAKQMEKEQIMDAFNDGINDECIGGNKLPEQYYTETFKSE
jgi:hypothetical protein